MIRLIKIKELFNRLNFNTFLRVFFLQVVQKIVLPESKFYFAIYGEDVFLHSLMKLSKSKFYVEIGANEPIANSNTFKFYLLGWKGILVDGNPEMVEKLKKIRKNDIVLHEFVSNNPKPIEFYISDDSLFSSSDKNLATNNFTTNKITKSISLIPKTLTQILDENLPKNQIIDFLSIDVEGNDFNVLKSLDFNKYRPNFIIIEDCKLDKLNIQNHIFNQFLDKNNYLFIASDIQNLVFVEKNYLQHLI